MRLDLKRRWKGFLKRSLSYKLASMYGIIGIAVFCFGAFTIWQMNLIYDSDPQSFILDSPEKLRTIVFVCVVLGFFTITLFLSGLCFGAMFLLYSNDQEGRLNRIEEFLEEDGVFKFKKDEKH